MAKRADVLVEEADWITTGRAAAVFFALSALYFLPAFLPGRHIFGTDYLAGGYFFHEFVSERFAAGALPKWVPYVYGGLPLFANPGSAFHPFRHLADLLFPVALILPAIFVLSFFLGGLGMYLLARELGVRPWIAFVAGLAFEFTGLLLSYVYAGHDGRIIVAASTPLFFFFLHRGVRTGSFGPFLGAAATLGFALLSFQIQSAYYLLLAAGLWAVFALWSHGLLRQPRALIGRLALGLGAVAFGFALAAVNFLPFLGYVDASPRGGEEGRGWDYATEWSMPPGELLGLAVPEQAGASIADEQGRPALPTYQGDSPFKLHTEYAGAAVLGLALLGILYARRDRYWLFFAGLGFFTLTISFGDFTPLYRLYYEVLPGTRRFRAPNIAFFLVSFSLPIMAALTLERIARARHALRSASARNREVTTAPGVAWIALLGLALLAVLGAALAGADARTGDAGRAAGWLRFAFFAAAGAGLLWLWLGARIPTRVFAIALAALTVIDLWVVGRPFFQTTDPPERLYAADHVVQHLRSQPADDRIWAIPPGVVPPEAAYPRAATNYLMHWDVRQAGGEHGNQLQRWNEYVGAGQERYVDWHNLIQHPVFLDAANIRWLVLAAELDSPALREANRGPLGIVYENLTALPRAYLVPAVEVVDPPQGALAAMTQPGWNPRERAFVYDDPGLPPEGGDFQGSAHVSRAEPDRIVVETSSNRPALLIIADPWYDGWTAHVDTDETPVLQANHALRGVVVPSGTHTVELEFGPAELRLGFWIHVLGLLLLAGYGGALLHGAWRRRPRAAAS
ncbi:MAG: YfhO family protein [Longimicrobiales bacterium]